MDLYSFAPIAAALDGAYFIVTALADALVPLAGTASSAVAVILITILVRALLIPVGRSQVRAEITRRRLAPQLQALQRRYQKSPEILRRKTMELYTEQNASPLAGCLPTLLQAPVLSTVYGLFILATVNGHANTLLSDQLFGIDLGASFLHQLAESAAGVGVIVFPGLLLVIAGVAWLSRRAALRMAPPAVEGAPALPGSLTGVLSWLPFVTVIFAALVPLAAVLYLTVSTTWTLVERSILRKRMN